MSPGDRVSFHREERVCNSAGHLDNAVAYAMTRVVRRAIDGNRVHKHHEHLPVWDSSCGRVFRLTRRSKPWWYLHGWLFYSEFLDEGGRCGFTLKKQLQTKTRYQCWFVCTHGHLLASYHAHRNQFERFRWFLELSSRFDLDFRVQRSTTHNVTVHVHVLWPVCTTFRMLWRPWRFTITWKYS